MKPYYDHGGIVIYHGDCREILPSLDDYSCLVFDPPYGIGFSTNRVINGQGASWANIEIANDRTTEVRDWVLSAVTVPTLCFGTWKNQRPSATREVLIWDKGPASGMGDLSLPWKRSWEEIYIIGTGFSGFRDEGVIKGCTVVTWESRGRSHPNEKPKSLLVRLLEKCPEGRILDATMGSGTTLVAAKELGRRAIGIELEERYCEIAAKRLEQEMLFTPPVKQSEPEQAPLFGEAK